MRILVAEDEVLLALVLQTCLEQEDHEVLGPVASMEEGLRLAEADRPGLALVNINLKGAGNGIELARELRSRWAVPSLFTSGQVQEARDARDAAWGYIGKPYIARNVAESVTVVQALIEGRTPDRIPQALELFVPLPDGSFAAKRQPRGNPTAGKTGVSSGGIVNTSSQATKDRGNDRRHR